MTKQHFAQFLNQSHYPIDFKINQVITKRAAILSTEQLLEQLHFDLKITEGALQNLINTYYTPEQIAAAIEEYKNYIKNLDSIEIKKGPLNEGL